MDPISQQAFVAAGAGGSDPLYVDDVFSTYVYDGTGSTQTINNGIDLSGEGGLVWFKNRSTGVGAALGHVLQDTERGNTKFLRSQASSQEETSSSMISSFNSNGFTFGSDTNINYNGDNGVAWTFRKAPGFFDVVTYTGNGTSGRTVNHSLGSVPGMIVVKNLTDTGYSWAVWHRSLGSNGYLFLNSDNQGYSSSNYFPSQPTASNFVVGSSGLVNINGDNYVAYVFAHDDQSFGTDSDEAIIKCGSFTSDSSGSFNVNLGWEPQLVLIKKTSANGDWFLLDAIRGLARTHVSTLRPNTSGGDINYIAEGYCYAHASGFASDTNFFGASATFAYMAIRRPHKPPTAATEVFDLNSRTSGSSNNLFSTALPYVDSVWNKTASTGDWIVSSRLQGEKFMRFNAANSESGVGTDVIQYDFNYKINPYFWNPNTTESNYIFRRAPGFFDVAIYKGTGSQQTLSHNLGVTPELFILKARTSTGSSITWWTWAPSAIGTNKYLKLNAVMAETANTNLTQINSSSWTTGTNSGGANTSGGNFVAYFFASLDGISKVGTYSGTGYDVNVDCGFTAGARLVVIKRTDSSGAWYVWDTARGIVSGNDPYFQFDSNNASVTNTDYIDPLNAGFTVTSSAPAALNTSGGTYLFLAIA
tara:strand:- start:314 stop:2248 length:1935 start_codon:yes stop_codon:yes gene_type:complete